MADFFAQNRAHYTDAELQKQGVNISDRLPRDIRNLYASIHARCAWVTSLDLSSTDESVLDDPAATDGSTIDLDVNTVNDL